MTDSDRQMDRALGELPSLEPARTVWPQLEAQLDRQEKRLRFRTVARYAASAVAASLAVVAVLIYSPVDRQPERVSPVELQKTVENAVKDARPEATFSNLELNGRPRTLEALKVSAKPRRISAAPAISDSGSREAGEKRARENTGKPVDEF